MRMVSLRKPWPRRLFPNCKRNFHDAHLTTPIDLGKNHRFLRVDPSDSQKVTDLNVALNGFVPKTSFPWPSSWALAPGYSFLYGTWVPYKAALLEDGTDKWHLPGSDFKFRIWAGGEVHFRRSGEPLVLNDLNRSIATVQETKDVRYKDDARVAYVKIKRTTLSVQPGMKSTPENFQRFSNVEPKNLDNPPDELDPHVIEYRWLVFSKEPPGPAMINAETKMPPCPGNDDFHLVTTPDAALLFQFSALTNNAHSIHLDSEYAKKVYGLPAKVVHGPLATHLMLRILHYGLRLREYKLGLTRGLLRIASLKYTNIAPLYVDEEMKISCRKVDGGDRAEDWQTWDVWLSKKTGPHMVWKVAVKGVAKVNVLHKNTARSEMRKYVTPKDKSDSHARSKDEEIEQGNHNSEEDVDVNGETMKIFGTGARRIRHPPFPHDGSIITMQNGRTQRRGFQPPLKLRQQQQLQLQQKYQTENKSVGINKSHDDKISRLRQQLTGEKSVSIGKMQDNKIRERRRRQLKHEQRQRQTEKEVVRERRAWELWDDELGPEPVRELVMESEPAVVSNTADFDEVELAVERLVDHYEGLSRERGRGGSGGVDGDGEVEVEGDGDGRVQKDEIGEDEDYEGDRVGNRDVERERGEGVAEERDGDGEGDEKGKKSRTETEVGVK